jgi:hypothetical protein
MACLSALVFYPQIAQIRADYFGEEGAVWRSKAQMGKCERGRFFHRLIRPIRPSRPIKSPDLPDPSDSQ